MTRFVVLALALLAVPAQAQVISCGPTVEIQANLLRQYKELPIALGTSEIRNSIITLFASPDGDTWTITETNAQGQTCIRYFGVRLETNSLPPLGDPS